MNMSAMAAVLPSSPSAGGAAPRSGHGAPDTGSTGFSGVLAGQHDSKPGLSALPDAGGKTEGKAGKPRERDADKEAADETSSPRDDQAMTLPQMALHIAAEVAAVRQSPQAGRSLPADRAALIPTAERTAAGAAGKKMEASGNRPVHGLVAGHARRDASGQPINADEQPLAFAAAAATKATGETGADSRREAAPSPPLNARQVGAMTGAKQAVLAMQQRMQSGEPSPDVAALENFLSGKPQAGPEFGHPALAASLEAGGTQAAGQGPSLAGLASGMTPGAFTSGPSAATAGTLPTVSTPLDSPNWGVDFSRQFVSLAQGAGNLPHTAELRLDPPELGPLRITINLSDNTASAVFVSPHAAVRQTVENALPQLQQQLAQAGISLGQTSVSDHGQSGQADHQSPASGGQAGGGGAGLAAAPAEDAAMRSPARATSGNTLVDTFA